MSHRNAIAVLDFGGQYVHLIATKVRALGVYAEIRDPEDPVESFADYAGLILSGSPDKSSHDEGANWSRGVLDLGIPVLGFCFGHQEIAKHGGGRVEHARREYGAATLHQVRPSPLFEGLGPEETVWMSHGDTVTAIGPGFVELGYSTGGTAGSGEHRYAAIAHEERRQYGLQFHPEVDDTPCGERILRNFAIGICGAAAGWIVGDQVEARCQAIREQVGDRTVLLLVSGGVDSTVAAKLFERALGTERLHLLHIDNGLMRKDESARVVAKMEALGLGPSLRHVDATDAFLAALQGLVDPEAKRKAIGDTFVDVFEREAAELRQGDVLLAQGTIYPDTIETGGTKRADVIKTHHNRVPIIQEMMRAGRVVEPLADLYKTEVRELGRALGLDPASIERHPFPGPGLGIRVACAAAPPEDATAPAFDPAAIQPEVDAVLAGTDLRGLPLPVRSVGVKGDLRSYEHPVLLCGPFPGWEALTDLATALTKRVPGINRCLYELSAVRPRAAREVPATVTPQRLDLLRDLDDIVMRGLERHGLLRTIWQCPTVIVPLVFEAAADRDAAAANQAAVAPSRGAREMVVIRPVYSERAMTARPAWLGDELARELTKELLAHSAVGLVAIDATTKPPATIEWE